MLTDRQTIDGRGRKLSEDSRVPKPHSQRTRAPSLRKTRFRHLSSPCLRRAKCGVVIVVVWLCVGVDERPTFPSPPALHIRLVLLFPTSCCALVFASVLKPTPALLFVFVCARGDCLVTCPVCQLREGLSLCLTRTVL